MTTAYYTDMLILGDGRVFSPGLVVIHNNGIVKYAGPPDHTNVWADQKIEVDGALIPGFVNAHTHLELSWMKGLIPQGLGLDGFITEVMRLRSDSPELRERRHAMDNARKMMIRYGTVAAGDICNGLSSLPVKKMGGIKWSSFIEVFGSDEEAAEKHFRQALSVLDGLAETGKTNLVPHATYSVSKSLFELIFEYSRKTEGILSIHHQENPDENDYFLHGKGQVIKRLKDIGLEVPSWIPVGKRPLEFLIPLIERSRRLLLVHNTYAELSDMEKAKKAPFPISWVICPDANLYIERKLPDINLMRKEKLEIAVGTDSLASASSLSMLKQLKIIQKHYPHIPASEMILWACRNGARALGIQHEFGSISPGTRPGLLLLQDLNGDRFSSKTQVKRLA